METLSVNPARLRQHRAFLRTASVTNAQDASGSHSFSYGHFGNTDTESQQIASETYALTEHWDSFGRSTGYSLRKDGSDLSRATTSYGTLGRIDKVGFAHDGKDLAFRYNYLDGSNLLQTLTMPNGVTLTQSYEEKRNLLTGMDYVRGNSLITQRQYSYDKIGRPVTRGTNYPGRDIQHSDSFIYNRRSELTDALLGDASYTYAYDNIGNREIAQEAATDITYDANELNQYTRITTDGENFTPEFDADGNQTLVQTSSGIWRVTYNEQNRAVKFVSGDGKIVITCAYDYMGRRFEKKVVKDGTTTLHERYIYRGYLQIAALDLLHDSALIHTILWDATQPIATRPLAICMGGTYYTYGWDLTKNVTEIFSFSAHLQVDYVYTPFGQVREDGIIPQPIQWSSEMYDAETGLVYYNYRYYNPLDGRWTRRDPVEEEKESEKTCLNPYPLTLNSPTSFIDLLGLVAVFTNDSRNCIINIFLPIKLYFLKSIPKSDRGMIVEQVKNTISSEWNGHRKGCCLVVVTVSVEDITNDRHSFWDHFHSNCRGRRNCMEVTYNQTAGYKRTNRSYVRARGRRPGRLVLSPNDVHNNTDTRHSYSTWGIAHEVGHLMGLENGYDVKTNEIKDNHSPDEMMSAAYNKVQQADIDNLVRNHPCQCDRNRR